MDRMKSRSFLWVAVLALGFTVGVLFITNIGFITNNESHQSAAEIPQVSAQGKDLLNQFSVAFEAAAAKVNPAVVPIFSESVTKVQNPLGSNSPFGDFFGDDFFKHFFGNPQEQRVRSLGSGVIVSSDGYVLTNNHVVKGAEKLTVVLKKNERYEAKVVGTDPQTDVAVIKIDATNLPVASLGNSENLRVGQWVIAVGNPFQLLHTVTAGIISATGRASMNLADYEDFIQTDASINPGNSGGALADLDGNVVGINTAIYSPTGGGNVGIGFAIPIDMAKNVMDQLIKSGKVTRGYMGLLLQEIDQNMADALRLGTTKGALVADVTEGGPADKAGIKRGDIITKLDGTEIESTTELRNMVAEKSPGTDVIVTVLRDGNEKQLTVDLGERPAEVAEGRGGREEQSHEKIGLSVQALNPALADQLGYQNETGVVITNVNPGSAAAAAGMQRGDLIKEVNQKRIRSVADFEREIGGLKGGDSVAFLMRRGDNTFYAALKLP